MGQESYFVLSLADPRETKKNVGLRKNTLVETKNPPKKKISSFINPTKCIAPSHFSEVLTLVFGGLFTAAKISTLPETLCGQRLLHISSKSLILAKSVRPN